jgi:hypothetical protein
MEEASRSLLADKIRNLTRLPHTRERQMIHASMRDDQPWRCPVAHALPVVGRDALPEQHRAPPCAFTLSRGHSRRFLYYALPSPWSPRCMPRWAIGNLSSGAAST